MVKKRKNRGGRPSVITKDVLLKLEEAFELCCTDEQACLHAGISTSSFYNYQQKNLKFKERKAQLKLNLNIHARQVIYDALKDGNVNIAKWYLERRVPEEYSLRRINQKRHNPEKCNEKVKFVVVD